MILPDVNLLVYAYNADAPHHGLARRWWEHCLGAPDPVGMPWAVALGFVRVMTHRAVLSRPLDARVALGHVRDWLDRPNVEIVEPGPRHLQVLDELFGALGIAGALTTDAHLAALAIERQAELHSNDADFARFAGLRWHNPLSEAAAR